jgi:putative transposase
LPRSSYARERLHLACAWKAGNARGGAKDFCRTKLRSDRAQREAHSCPRRCVASAEKKTRFCATKLARERLTSQMARAKMVQSELPFRSWGGPRPRSGRKPKGLRADVPHGLRDPLAARYPVHVTARLRAGLPSLRRKESYRALMRAFEAGAERNGFRLTQYSVQSNHVHLITEAPNRLALSRGLQGLLIRVARVLNRAWHRKGSIFSERYHDRILRTPREVRNALAYVLNNAKRHGIFEAGVDPFSSGRWFDGWREALASASAPPILAKARTWLLTLGWRRWGLISLDTVPSG